MTSWQKGSVMLGAAFFVFGIIFRALSDSPIGPTVGYRAEWAEQRQTVRDRDLPGKVRQDLETMEREAGAPQWADVAERVAAWYTKERDWQRAAGAANKAYRWTPGDSPKLAHRARTAGLAYRRAGRAHKAVKLYDGFLRGHPGAPRASLVGAALIDTLSAIKRYEEAVRRYNELRRKYPELERDMDALRGLRAAYLGLGEDAKLRELQEHIADVRARSDAAQSSTEEAREAP